MPTYEYRCRTCEERFEQRRPMAAADDPAACPSGHRDSTRLLSAFAAVGSAGREPAPPAAPCRSACACYPD